MLKVNNKNKQFKANLVVDIVLYYILCPNQFSQYSVVLLNQYRSNRYSKNTGFLLSFGFLIFPLISSKFKRIALQINGLVSI